MLPALTALAVLASASTAAAQVVQTDHLRSQLVADATAVVPGRTLRVGLRFEHDPHWHSYWKNPGDSGLPTRIAFELPDGFEAAAIDWPAPQRFVLGDIVNYGYADRALLPVTIAVPATLTAREVTIHAKASWLVCESECIPGRATYALTLPVQPDAAADPRWRDDFAWADARRPQPLAAAASMRLDGDTVEVDVRGSGLPAFDAAEVFPATPQLFANGARAAWTRAADGWHVRWTRSEFFNALPATAELVVVADGRAHALSVAAEPHAAPTPQPRQGDVR